MASSSRLRSLSTLCELQYSSTLSRRAFPSPLLQHTPHTANFSTSIARPAVAKVKGGGGGKPSSALKTKSLRLSKSVRQDTGRRPQPGDRKAQRKRIVLSNTNAFEVKDLKDLDAAALKDAETWGRMMGLPGPTVDLLRAVEAFKPGQGWNLFARPATLMRKETKAILELMESASAAQSPKTARTILIGERLSGKTTLVLQALTIAFLKEWVVINIPDAVELVNGHTEYAPKPNSEPVEYIQKGYALQLLEQITKANQKVLASMTLSQKHDLPIPVQPDMALDRFATLGIKSPDIAWPVFQALWSELTQPSQDKDGLRRPPVLFALDGLAHIMGNSTYLSPDLKPIHAHDFALVKQFVDYLSGKRSLPNGGLVLAATSGSSQPASPGLQFGIEQNEARINKTAAPQWNPYKKIDERTLQSISNVDVLRLSGLSRDEVKTIIEYYAASGMVRQTVSDHFVSEKWSLSGGGNIGELERGTVRLRI